MRYAGVIGLFLAVWLVSCDLDVYFGFQNKSQDFGNSTRIDGRVTNFYTGKPVALADVQIGAQETFTDDSGRFALRYLLSESELRNKPTTVRILKKNFYPLKLSVILDPVANTFPLRLKYAAPLILGVARFHHNGKIAIQAVVKDYQGVYSIEQVQAVVFYRSAAVADSVRYPLQLVDAENTQVGHYQTLIPIRPDLESRLFIVVRDRDGYTARLFRPGKRVDDAPLFPVDQ